jgi:hypothetical protein
LKTTRRELFERRSLKHLQQHEDVAKVRPWLLTVAVFFSRTFFENHAGGEFEVITDLN